MYLLMKDRYQTSITLRSALKVQMFGVGRVDNVDNLRPIVNRPALLPKAVDDQRGSPEKGVANPLQVWQPAPHNNAGCVRHCDTPLRA